MQAIGCSIFWEDQTQLTPTWKAAYIRKVATPDLKTYVLEAQLQHQDRKGFCRRNGSIAEHVS